MVLRLPISPRDWHSARPSPIDAGAMCLGRPYKGRPQVLYWSGNTARPVGERSPIFQRDFKVSPGRTRPGGEPPGKAAWYCAFDVGERHVEPDFGRWRRHEGARALGPRVRTDLDDIRAVRAA